MKFAIEVKPFKNESFISWFTRTAFLNGSDPKSFALSIWMKDSIFYLDLDRFISKQDISRICKCTSLSYAIIRKLTLELQINEVNTSISNNSYKKWYFLHPLAQKGKIRTNGIHFCSECLKLNTPYINKYWRLSWFIFCPIHKIRLLLSCPKCNQVFSPEKQDYLNPFIYLCSNCKYDLRTIKLESIDKDFLTFQNKLTNAFSNKRSIISFNLLKTKSKKDLFLTLNILLSFIYKILRQPLRFKTIIKAFGINSSHKFTIVNNGTFSRLNSQDRYELLQIVWKLLNCKTEHFIFILINNGVTQNILSQTYKTLSTTILYINRHLSNKKLIRKVSRQKKDIKPKEIPEIEKLFRDIKPYLLNIE